MAKIIVPSLAFYSRKLRTDPIRIIHRYHRLLCAEGTSYFLLALIEFLTHIVTVLHHDLSVVKLIDIIIGIWSIPSL